MFNVGGPEILVIAVLALLVLGPEQLPKAMRTLGNVVAEIKKVSGGFQAEMKSAMDQVTDAAKLDSSPSKPQSGPSMDQVKADSATNEVVARNDAPATGTDASAPSDGPAPADDATPARPAIDPADRAAG